MSNTNIFRVCLVNLQQQDSLISELEFADDKHTETHSNKTQLFLNLFPAYFFKYNKYYLYFIVLIKRTNGNTQKRFFMCSQNY